MSQITERPQLVYPVAGAALHVTSGAVPGALGAWVPFFRAEAPTVIAGAVISDLTVFLGFANMDVEIVIGAGEEGLEVEKGAFRYYGRNSGIGGPMHGPQPREPIGIFTAGTLISVALRGTPNKELPLSLRYFENYASDYADIDEVTLGSLPPMLPDADAMVTIEPAAVAWDPSAWVAVGDVLDVDLDVIALLPHVGHGACDQRWELGRLAIDSEIVEALTVFPTADGGSGCAYFSELPACYPFVAGEQVYLRLYSSSAAADDHRASLMVFRHLPGPGPEVIGELLWAAFTFREPAV